MRLKHLMLGAAAVLLGTSVSAAQIDELASPASVNSALSRLTTDDDGQVHLSWVTSESAVSTLYFSTLVDENWTAPEQIASGSDWFVNWADFPFHVATESSMTAHWLQKSSEGTYNYDVVATFRDSKTGNWSDGQVVHTDGVSAEHGFVSMLPMARDRTFITWLDGRNTAGHGGHAAEGHGAGGMTMRAAILDSGGGNVAEWELDALTCDCCQTSSAMTSNGPVVAYRDRSEDEIRDIYITRLVDGEWTTPMPVFSDGWQIAGCPVNGPSVVAQDEQVAVAWFSAQDNNPVVSLAFSSDHGATFGKRVIVAKDNTNGRVSTAMLESGNVAVSWMEIEGPAAALWVALYDTTGKQLGAAKVADTQSSRRSGFPVITARGDDVFITWTDVSSESRVRIARVRF